MPELDALRQENADLVHRNEQLEVCVGQLMKEVRFLKDLLRHAGNSPAK